ncbi:MAG: 16S rRNA (guanine(966)-N(2))-methyltransferase RsmD [Ignavibacteriae bacterium HGW-Ignavibacteriae-1]|nr:MAG: 16S rRNA (guanine(966)-N(2))-methyltransferase RsmD [Ignavibacteriae bacterium HGW-Ignavibacteriae-1]
MRLTTGIYGGLHYSGKIPSNIRPTSDKTRQSIFNVLANLVDFDDCICLDLCSGTGALGFEALSRGAKHITLVDNSKKSCDIARDVANLFKIPKEDYSIICRDALKFVRDYPDDSPKFDLIFCDPPYKIDIINPLLILLSEKNMLNDEAVITLEYAKDMKLLIPPAFSSISHKEFGETQVEFVETV